MSGWTLLDSMTWSAFGWAVIHFIWQGALIGLLTAGVLRFMHTRPASWRYATACCALAICLLSFLATFTLLVYGTQVPIALTRVDPVVSHLSALQFSGSSGPAASGLALTGTIAMVLWFIGFVLMSVRFLVHWRGSRRLARIAVTSPEPIWCTLFEELKRELRVSPAIQLLESGLVQTPMVVGWLSPVVLVPAEVFTNLSREQLKLVFLHELSHLRRMDHLINLFQSIVECLLFFHPATWWISNQIRIEREYCCDALTVENHDQPRVFAEALFTLERLRLARSSAGTPATLHATGGKLMSRISRLLELETATCSRSAWRTPLAIALSSLVAAGCLVSLDAPAGAASPLVQQDRSAEEAFPSTDSMLDGLQAEIARGHLSAEQAIQIERIHERLLMGIETGRVTAEQALKILEERTAAVYENGVAEVKEQTRARMTKADYDEAVSKMLRMVKSGEITREQMEQRLTRMKEMVESAPTFTKAEYDAAVKKMTAMVKSGEITREQMEQRLERMKQMMVKSPTFTKAQYDAAVKKMTAMVKSGEITREQMEQRLERMRQMMSAKKPGINQAKYDAAVDELSEMVKSGKITRAQMKQRLGDLKRRMEVATPSLGMAEYADAEAKMAKMVEAGTITRKQMDERLSQMRERMATSPRGDAGQAKRSIPTPPEGLSRMELREWYQRVVERLDMAVESGRMTVDEKTVMLEKIKASLRK